MFEQYVYAIVLQMASGGVLHLRANIGQSVQAAFLNTIRALDGQLAQRLHDDNQRKLYTTSPLWADSSTVKVGQDVYVRFAFLDSTIAELFVEQFLLYGHNHTLNIDGIQLSITNIYATPEGHLRAGRLSITQSDDANCLTQVTLNFITPTAFSRRNGKRIEYRTDMSPDLVWKYARQMWSHAGGNDPGPEFDNWVRQHCFIKYSSLIPQRVDFKRFFVSGVHGQVTYVLGGDTPQDEYYRLWCYLSHFAAYSSIGYKTTMGMGQVMPYIEEQ